MEIPVERARLWELKALIAEIQLIELQARIAIREKTDQRDEILKDWEVKFGGKIAGVDFEKGMVQISGESNFGNSEELGTGRVNGGGGGAIPEIHAGISAGISPELGGDRGEPHGPLPPCDGRVDEGGE